MSTAGTPRSAEISVGRRCAVLGSPVAHSLSPAMHRAAYAEIGLDWTYDAIDVPAGGLAGFVDGLDAGWCGLSVTAPLKREALERADRADDVAVQVGAANTLVRDDDGSWSAANTDVPGAIAALREAGVESLERVRIVGGGATAASIALAVAGLGASTVDLCVRDRSRAGEAARVARRAGLAVTVRELTAMDDAADAGLLVATVPGGSADPAWLRRVGAVFDVAYAPWPSPLVEAGQAAGLPTVTGLDLLAHQAVLQVRLMTGADVAAAAVHGPALSTLLRD